MCTLRLTKEKLFFMLTDKVANGGVSMWCELLQENFFDEFQIEGISFEYNEIYLELAPENLSRALKTAHNAKSVKIKLTKKHCPCITIAVELVLEANMNGDMNLKIDTDLVSVSTHFRDLGNPPFSWDDAHLPNGSKDCLQCQKDSLTTSLEKFTSDTTDPCSLPYPQLVHHLYNLSEFGRFTANWRISLKNCGPRDIPEDQH
ncbi:HUS1 protein, partial [Polypterus senegalus]